MATTTLADQALTDAWVDLTVALPALVSVDAIVQNVGPGAVALVLGGADPTGAGKSGFIMRPTENLTINAANVWAKSLGNGGVVSVTTL